jgi:hypothetical protein
MKWLYFRDSLKTVGARIMILCPQAAFTDPDSLWGSNGGATSWRQGAPTRGCTQSAQECSEGPKRGPARCRDRERAPGRGPDLLQLALPTKLLHHVHLRARSLPFGAERWDHRDEFLRHSLSGERLTRSTPCLDALQSERSELVLEIYASKLAAFFQPHDCRSLLLPEYCIWYCVVM